MLRIANSDVTGDAFTKSEFAEKPKRCSESLLSMLAFVFEIVEDWNVVGDWLARCTNYTEIVRIETCGHRSSPFFWGRHPAAVGRAYVRHGIP
jgi:hypothetical protein